MSASYISASMLSVNPRKAPPCTQCLSKPSSLAFLHTLRQRDYGTFFVSSFPAKSLPNIPVQVQDLQFCLDAAILALEQSQMRFADSYSVQS